MSQKNKMLKSGNAVQLMQPFLFLFKEELVFCNISKGWDFSYLYNPVPHQTSCATFKIISFFFSLDLNCPSEVVFWEAILAASVKGALCAQQI